MEVYRFRAKIYGDIVSSNESCPIYDSCNSLVGAFVVDSGDSILGFLSGNANEIALSVTTGGGFWFTPVENDSGKVVLGVVTYFSRTPDPSYRHSPQSVWVDKALEVVVP